MNIVILTGCIRAGKFGLALLMATLLLFASSGCPPSTGAWRSILYPANWTPSYEDNAGRYLHDFSYAGYHYGEDDPPSPAPGTVFNAVTGYGADNTGASDATAAIQSAIADASVAGGVVFLPEGLYRCDGVLAVTSPGVVIQGEGQDKTKLYFTKTDGMAYNAHVSFRGNVTRGTDILLAQDGESRSFDVYVDDASSLSVGDEVSLGWVITDEFIAEHNMTGTWVVFVGQWKPIFRRTVAAVDTSSSPHKVTFDVPLRYAARVRDDASLREESGYLSECGIESLSIANAVDWDTAWSLNQVDAISMLNVKDCWIRNINSFASPHPDADGYHLQSNGLLVEQSKRVTVENCHLQRTQNRGSGGNGYLFQVGTSNEVLTRDCVGLAGRHNFIQNWDFGTTGCVWLRCRSAGSTNMVSKDIPIGLPAYSEFHHSLSMACLVDSCRLDDGWYAGNRRDESSGAGHTSTENVFWNTRGNGKIRSYQYGVGYVIGTSGVSVSTSLLNVPAEGTAPEDYVEGAGSGMTLEPHSIYEDQRSRRLSP